MLMVIVFTMRWSMQSKFSQGTVRSQSCSLEPASGRHWWLRWEKLQRWGIVWNSLTDRVLSCFCLQVLRFNAEARTWTQIGSLEHRRSYHAIVEANLNALCPPVGNINPAIKRHQHHQYHYHQGTVGNLNPFKKDNRIINSIITKELCVQIYVNL